MYFGPAQPQNQSDFFSKMGIGLVEKGEDVVEMHL